MTENQEDFKAQTPDKEFLDIIWNKVSQPPPDALKQIDSGRMRGKTDINPQWRYKKLTEQFGPCGEGWKYKINRVWPEPGSEGQIFAFAEVHLFVKIKGQWSDAIPGIGGSMLVAMEKKGLHSSDEGYKMAITDALSVCCKMLGVAADIYAGRWDGMSYREDYTPQYINKDQEMKLSDLITESETDLDKFLDFAGVKTLNKIITDQYETLERLLIAKKEKLRQPGDE